MGLHNAAFKFFFYILSHFTLFFLSHCLSVPKNHLLAFFFKETTRNLTYGKNPDIFFSPLFFLLFKVPLIPVRFYLELRGFFCCMIWDPKIVAARAV